MIGHFPYKSSHDLLTSYTYTISKSSIEACGCVAAHAEVVRLGDNGEIVQSETAWGAGTPFVSKGTWATYFEYCVQDCNTTGSCNVFPGSFLTYTEAAWGETPAGVNTGTFLHNNFAGAFPQGLVIGDCGNFMTFSSAQGITDFLPRNKDIDGINVAFAGQVTALSLSIGFDNAYTRFGASSTHISDLYVASGNFTNWTVAEVLAEANRAVGGCSNYTIEELYEVVYNINENFANGTINNGFLNCERTEQGG
jgi:hypothetical protein